MWTLAWTEANFYSVFICLNLSIARSLRRNGRWLFSTRLLACRPIVCLSANCLFVGNAEVPHGGSVGLEPIRGIASAAPCRFRARFIKRSAAAFARPGDVAFQYLALVIDGSPEVVGLAVDLHEHLIKVPTPMAKPTHRAHSLAADIGREHRAKSIPPESDSLMTEIDAALEQQVLDVAQ